MVYIYEGLSKLHQDFLYCVSLKLNTTRHRVFMG